MSRPRLRTVVTVIAVVGAVKIAAIVAAKMAAQRAATGDETSDQLRRAAVLGGTRLAMTSQSLRHARFDLGMGGIDLDLTHASLAPEGADIEVFGAMGGVNITVPEDWQVTAESDSKTSGLNYPDTSELPDDAPHLHVHSHARMSGVNVQRA